MVVAGLPRHKKFNTSTQQLHCIFTTIVLTEPWTPQEDVTQEKERKLSMLPKSTQVVGLLRLGSVGKRTGSFSAFRWRASAYKAVVWTGVCLSCQSWPKSVDLCRQYSGSRLWEGLRSWIITVGRWWVSPDIEVDERSRFRDETFSQASTSPNIISDAPWVFGLGAPQHGTSFSSCSVQYSW